MDYAAYVDYDLGSNYYFEFITTYSWDDIKTVDDLIEASINKFSNSSLTIREIKDIIYSDKPESKTLSFKLNSTAHSYVNDGNKIEFKISKTHKSSYPDYFILQTATNETVMYSYYLHLTVREITYNNEKIFIIPLLLDLNSENPGSKDSSYCPYVKLVSQTADTSTIGSAQLKDFNLLKSFKYKVTIDNINNDTSKPITLIGIYEGTIVGKKAESNSDTSNISKLSPDKLDKLDIEDIARISKIGDNTQENVNYAENNIVKTINLLKLDAGSPSLNLKLMTKVMKGKKTKKKVAQQDFPGFNYNATDRAFNALVQNNMSCPIMKVSNIKEADNKLTKVVANNKTTVPDPKDPSTFTNISPEYGEIKNIKGKTVYTDENGNVTTSGKMAVGSVFQTGSLGVKVKDMVGHDLTTASNVFLTHPAKVPDVYNLFQDVELWESIINTSLAIGKITYALLDAYNEYIEEDYESLIK